MKKIFRKSIILSIVAILFLQPLLSIVFNLENVYAKSGRNREALEAEGYTVTRVERKYKVTYKTSFEVNNVPACYTEYFQVGKRFSTNLNGVSAVVTAYGSDFIKWGKHTTSTYNSHYEEFKNVRIAVEAVYETDWKTDYLFPDVKVFGQLGADGWGPIKFEKNMRQDSVEVVDTMYYASGNAKSKSTSDNTSSSNSSNNQTTYINNSQIAREVINYAIEDDYSYDSYDEYYDEDYYYEESPKVVITDNEDSDIQLSNYNKSRFIKDLYERMFGNTPNQKIIDEYFDRTPQQIVIDFVFGSSGNGKYGTVDADFKGFIRYCYDWILGRDATEGEVNDDYLDLVYYEDLGADYGVIKRNYIRSIVESQDFIEKYGGERKDKTIDISYEQKLLYFKSMYYNITGKMPTEDIMEAWKDRTPQSMAVGVMFCEKSENRNSTSKLTYDAFVGLGYRGIVGREGSEGTIKYYSSKIDTSSKSDVLKDMVESEAFIEMRKKDIVTLKFNDKNLCTSLYAKLESRNMPVLKQSDNSIVMYKNDISKVTSLDLTGKSISDLTGLSTFSDLTALNLKNNNLTKIDELSKLTKLEKLILSGNKIGENIGSISNLTNLKHLQAENCGLRSQGNFNKLSNLTNLTELFLSKNQLTNISSLKNFTKLVKLYADDNNISDIGQVGNISNLSELHIKRNNVTKEIMSVSDLIPNTILYAKDKNYDMAFENCKLENDKIVILDLDKDASITVKNGNFEGYKLVEKKPAKVQLNDAVLANKLKEELTKRGVLISDKEENGKYILYIKTAAMEHAINSLDLTTAEGEPKITDISGLEVFGLSSLILDNNNVQNLEKLSSFKGLRTLSLKSCGLKDLTALKGLTNLVQLDVSNNEITNIDAISNLKNLKNLQLSSNKIENNLQPLTSLTELENLYIANNNITDLGCLKNLKLESLNLSYNNINYFNGFKTSNSNKTEMQNNEITIEADSREIEIPDILRAMYSYSMHSLEFTNCKIENGKLVIDDNAYKAEVRATSGIYSDTVIKINYIGDITPPVVDIQYNLNNETGNMDVVITSNEPMDIAGSVGWARSADNKTITKSYTYNTKEILEIRDLNKNSIEKEINITGLKSDRIPGISIEYSKTTATNRGVKVTISADVPLHDPQDGWVMADDRKSFSKVFEENISVLFTVDSEENYQKAMEISRKVDEGIPASDLMDEIDEVNYKRINFGFHISNIDKKAPDVQVEYNNNNVTKGTVIATIYSDEEIELKQNRGEFTKKVVDVDEEGNIKYGIAIYYTKNITEDVEVIDSAKNTSVAKIDIKNIDNKVDGLKYVTDTNAITNQNVNITVNANEKINVNNVGNSQASIIKNAKTLYKEARARVDSKNMLYEVAGNMTVTPIMTGEVNVLSKNPIAYLSENDNNNDGENTLSYEMTDNGYGAINATDMAGNSDAVFYDVNSIDKDAPIAGIESIVKNSDGSVTVKISVNEAVQLTDDISSWTLSEDMKTLTKTYRAMTNETIKLMDLAGNTTEVPVNVDNVETIKYDVIYQAIDGTNKYLVVITADKELVEMDGWRLLEDKKSLAKAVVEGTEEKLIINSVDGESVFVYISTKDEDDSIIENDEKADETSINDQTQSPNAFPQTGKYVIFTIILSIILTTLTIITLKRYVKSMEEE